MSTGGTSRASGEGLRLEVVSGNATGFAILVGERLLIGRHSEGPGRLADDPELSRHHAQISRDDGGRYLIEDLASTNGTIVNGLRISSPTSLAVGDSIEVGTTTIRVADAPDKPEPQPAVEVRAPTVLVDTPAAMRAVPPPTAETQPPTAAAAPPGAPRLALQLVFDPQTAEVEIRLDDTSDPIRLALGHGQVRPQ